MIRNSFKENDILEKVHLCKPFSLRRSAADNLTLYVGQDCPHHLI